MKSQLTSIDFNSKSKFQKVQIIKTIPFGTTLVLDGKTQSAQFDEAVYHEHLVHPAMLMHGNPKSVYIGGGGEYATARDVLKHTSVEKCVMVDIDEVVRSHGFCFRFVALPTLCDSPAIITAGRCATCALSTCPNGTAAASTTRAWRCTSTMPRPSWSARSRSSMSSSWTSPIRLRLDLGE